MTDYLELAKKVVETASAEGVEAEAYILDEVETQIQFGNGAVEKLSQSGARGMGVRVIRDGRVGYAYTSDFSDDAVEKTWKSALELSEVSTADEHRRLPEPQEIPDEDLEIWDPELPKISPEEKVMVGKRLTQAAMAFDPRVKMVPMAIYMDAVSHVYLANSKGFSGAYDRTMAGAFAMVIGQENDQVAEAYGIGFSNFFREFDPEQIGRQGAEKAVNALGGKLIPTQKMSVVFAPEVFSELLGYIALAMNAEAIQKKRSFLLDRLGQNVASDKVILLDNGRMKRGLASAPFDGEGVPTRATRLIDEGVFQAVIHDSYSASKDATVPTGNAQRGSHRSTPSLGASNFYLQPGPVSPDELVSGVQSGLYVTRIMQTGGVDPVSGDCSMGAYGQLIENGKLTSPVAGVTIATTLNDLLMNISEIGSDLMFTPFMGMVGAPTVRVDNVMVGGAKG